MNVKYLLLTYLLSLAINTHAEVTNKIRLPASLNSEGILFNLPLNYKIGYEANDDQQHLTELILENETVENWNELISYRILLNQNHTPIEKIFKTIKQNILSGCQAAMVSIEQTGKTHGYNFINFQQSCPKNPQTNKPEYTVYKLIQGKQHTYLLHIAFTSQPLTLRQQSKIQLALNTVQLCPAGKTGKICFFIDE